METEKRFNQERFTKQWGWLDLGMSVHDATGANLFEIMDKNVVEVLTLATYLLDKVEYIKMNNGNTNPGSK